jgi:hypothetical protein
LAQKFLLIPPASAAKWILEKRRKINPPAVSRPVCPRLVETPQIDDGSTNICERAVGLILLQLVDHISSARRIIY